MGMLPILILAFATPAFSNDMSGVGRIEYLTGGTCSAVLIAPDVIATAAHCTRGDSETGAIFRPSDTRGGRLFPIERFVTHPLYDQNSARMEWQFRFDIAVGKLAEPVPDSRATPLPLGDDAEIGSTLSIVSWRGGDDRLRQKACPVIEGAPGLVTLGCAVHGGESGSPVLRQTENGFEVIAIISSRVNQFGQPAAQATNVRLRIPPILERLDTP